MEHIQINPKRRLNNSENVIEYKENEGAILIKSQWIVENFPKGDNYVYVSPNFHSGKDGDLEFTISLEVSSSTSTDSRFCLELLVTSSAVYEKVDFVWNACIVNPNTQQAELFINDRSNDSSKHLYFPTSNAWESLVFPNGRLNIISYILVNRSYTGSPKSGLKFSPEEICTLENKIDWNSVKVLNVTNKWVVSKFDCNNTNYCHQSPLFEINKENLSLELKYEITYGLVEGKNGFYFSIEVLKCIEGFHFWKVWLLNKKNNDVEKYFERITTDVVSDGCKTYFKGISWEDLGDVHDYLFRGSDLIVLCNLIICTSSETTLNKVEPKPKIQNKLEETKYNPVFTIDTTLYKTEVDNVKTEAEQAFEGSKKLLESKQFSDMTLKIGNEEIQVHKAILMARNSFFREIISENPTFSIFEVKDLKFSAMHDFIHSIYTRQVRELNFEEAFDLFEVSRRFNAPELREKCESIMDEQIDIDTVVELLMAAEKYDIKSLFENSLEFIVKNLKHIDIRSFDKIPKQNYKLFMKILEKLALDVNCNNHTASFNASSK